MARHPSTAALGALTPSAVLLASVAMLTRRLRPLVVLGLTSGGVLLGAPALAEGPAPVAARPVEFSAGLRALVGGNYSSAPTDIQPPGYEGLGFAGESGGFGWGFGAYGELRAWRHLGLELSLSRDLSSLQREVTYNSAVKIVERVDYASTRVGGLLKGILPLEIGRLWLGVGMEAMLSPSAEADLEFTEGAQYVSNQEAVRQLIHAGDDGSTLLALGLGFTAHLGALLELPVELRAAHHLSQPSAWDERVKLRFQGNTLQGYTVEPIPTWDFRLGIGLGARF